MTNLRISWISPQDPPAAFPPLEMALTEPDGLLAAGGDLQQQRLLSAYRQGIFPWYEEGQPILWWSPDPRCIIYPDNVHIARRLAQYMRASDLELRLNRDFAAVVEACAGTRKSQQGTWITPAIKRAFGGLHDAGWAHSVEIWRGASLVGGLYGLSMGRVFFGESMFSRVDNASKFALAGLCRLLVAHNFALLDCQVASQHLLTMGAELLPRQAFAEQLATHCATRQWYDWPTESLPITGFVAK